MKLSLRIAISNNNVDERIYIFDRIFNDILGLSYDLEIINSLTNNIITFSNKTIILKDQFWNKNIEPLSYLHSSNLPHVSYVKNEFIVEDDIPVLYGNGDIIIEVDKIICGIDIFASSFFMLTRWEEYVVHERDNHNRFPGNSSIAFNNNFLHRPLVNEYVEMLWKMMIKLGYDGKRKDRKFELTLTHDIDILYFKKSIKTLVGDIIKRKDFLQFRNHFRYMFISNPVDRFDFLMSISEQLGIKSHFYFMSSDGNLEFDSNNYLNSNIFKSKIGDIKKRGHIIGFHPGYHTYDNIQRWKSEKYALEKAANQEILEGRQHYLRMDVTQTLSIWNENNMKIDSTLGYADKEGFRCGTGDIIPIFDFLNRKTLKLNERPLIIMDGTLHQYQNYTKTQASEILKYYLKIGEKYKTGITILFHNSSFYGEWQGYASIYEELLIMKDITTSTV